MEQAVKVTINWTEAGMLEGTSVEGGDVWEKIDTLLTMMLGAYRAQGGRGYAKTGFTVEWADGETYTGRMDIGDPNHGEGRQSLAHHINSFLDFMTGPDSPPYFTEEKVASAVAFREAYQIG